MKKLIRFAPILSVGLFSCASPVIPNKAPSHSSFSATRLGTTRKEIEKLFGPAEVQVPLNSIDLIDLNYPTKNKQLNYFFTVDERGKLVSKGKWLYDKELSIEEIKVAVDVIADPTTKKYSPCKTRSDKDGLFINKIKSAAVAVDRNGPALLEIATPEYIDRTINGLYNTCPGLQPKR